MRLVQNLGMGVFRTSRPERGEEQCEGGVDESNGADGRQRGVAYILVTLEVTRCREACRAMSFLNSQQIDPCVGRACASMA